MSVVCLSGSLGWWVVQDPLIPLETPRTPLACGGFASCLAMGRRGSRSAVRAPWKLQPPRRHGHAVTATANPRRGILWPEAGRAAPAVSYLRARSRLAISYRTGSNPQTANHPRTAGGEGINLQSHRKLPGNVHQNDNTPQKVKLRPQKNEGGAEMYGNEVNMYYVMCTTSTILATAFETVDLTIECMTTHDIEMGGIL